MVCYRLTLIWMGLLGMDYFEFSFPPQGLFLEVYLTDPLHSHSKPEFPKVSIQSFQLGEFLRKFNVYLPPASFPSGSMHHEADVVLNNYLIYQTMIHPWDSPLL